MRRCYHQHVQPLQHCHYLVRVRFRVRIRVRIRVGVGVRVRVRVRVRLRVRVRVRVRFRPPTILSRGLQAAPSGVGVGRDSYARHDTGRGGLAPSRVAFTYAQTASRLHSVRAARYFICAVLGRYLVTVRVRTRVRARVRARARARARARVRVRVGLGLGLGLTARCWDGTCAARTCGRP